ncbi:MAG: type IV pilus assembly protein PilM [Candidatus Wildermuthbacteria bacterium]|nr:type IV pilus assembly protein PilM [Candidatus Wildermuthbacteria bacterium]
MKLRLGSFKLLPRTSLGIDIGTASIKAAELSRWAGRVSLKNYGELQASNMYDRPFRTFEKSALLLSSKDVARAIRAVLQEAQITTKQAVFSLPDFSTFFTHFQLPPMSREELPEAVKFEARKHVPLPLSEVTFDWKVLEKGPQNGNPYKILLVAVPNEVINQYQEIASLAKLELKAMEAEVFGCIRSLIGEDKRAAALLDIGAQSTTVNIVYKKTLRVSHSMDIAGNNLTERISQSLSIDKKNAEEQKIAKGILSKDFSTILTPLLDILILEIRKVAEEFLQAEGKNIERVLIAGGSAQLSGLREYFESSIGKPAEIANPFQNLFYPPILEQKLKTAGPSYAVAVGMALRGLE